MAITMRVPWSFHTADLLCWTLAAFGLPGHKFMYHPRYSHMEFVFTDDKDALIFQLKTGCQSSQND